MPVVAKAEIKKESIEQTKEEQKDLPQAKVEVKKEAKKQFGNLFANIAKIANSEVVDVTKPEQKQAPISKEIEI